MPELLRSVVRYFGNVVGSRSCSPRRAARLPISISLAESVSRRQRAPSCTGETQDISSTGLSFTVTSMCLGNRHIFGETLDIRVELPRGWVSLRAVPTRYDFVEDGRLVAVCVVGARIVEMSDGSRAALDEYLRSRGSSAGEAAGRTAQHASAYGT